MKRSTSSRSSPISRRHSSSMPIQSSKVATRFILPQSYDGNFANRENTVILLCKPGVKRNGRPSLKEEDFQEVSELARCAPRAVSRPISFIFTLYGDMVHRLEPDGTLWIGALIRIMASFGVSSQAVRQAVSRMSRQGWLVASREGNRAYYAVTPRGRRRIEELSPR